jgi:hypothetical protein
VLLPVNVLLRRADEVGVVGAALEAKAAGRGHRRIAGDVGRAASTVRGWLRRFAGRAEQVRAVFTALLVGLVVDPGLPAAGPSVVADAVAAVAAFAAAAARRFGLGALSRWRAASAASSGRLLAPGWPAGAINASWPWEAAW